MTLPRFFSRVDDSISPLLTAKSDVREFLINKSVRLEASDDLEHNPFHLAGFLLLVNLCARLYPHLSLSAPVRVVDECRSIATQINPLCEITTEDRPSDAVLAWACVPRNRNSIVVAPAGWEVLVDLPEASRIRTSNMLVALAAAAIGAAELFRLVFAEFLPRGRTAASPGRFNVLTHAPTAAVLPELPSDIALGRVHLVGAGAVGQAAVYALARVSVTGVITVVDPEAITLSNLQRYVLTSDTDVGVSKCSLVERVLKKSRLQVVSAPTVWDAGIPETAGAEVVCTAVDTADMRIAIQASLPRRVYNAWTQPGDIGWSRHEQFGVEPCAACLYWPNGTRPSFHELIARATAQHELRVLAYLVAKTSVDEPLSAGQIPVLPQYAQPPEAPSWLVRSILSDIAVQMGVEPTQLGAWKGRLLADLYREGICGGALIRREIGEIASDMAVPLAHQSVLAGIMLATQLLVAARPELAAFRNPAIESRLDLLAGLPQMAARPRALSANCICADSDFVRRYREKWPWR